MSTTAITSELLVLNTRSADLPFIAGGGTANAIVATSTTDGWVVSPPSGVSFDERLVFILGSDGTGGTVTFKAGDRYPAHRVDLGDLVITLAANDGRVISVETSRFLQNDGTITVIPSTTGLVITAVVVQKGA
jgi:hypothetical protein